MKRLTNEEFIFRSKSIHGDRYDYSKTEYKNTRSKVVITCRDHGDFSITAKTHIHASEPSGCKICADDARRKVSDLNSGVDILQPAILYYVRVERLGEVAYKIGVTSKSLRDRFKKEFEYITVLETWEYSTRAEAMLIEEYIIKKHRNIRYTGKKLLRRGNTEMFNKDIRNML